MENTPNNAHKCCHCYGAPGSKNEYMDDYEQKYEPDKEYEEMSEKSRFWRTYADESTKFDGEMIVNWKEALDVLLLFAALFSALVTTFVVQVCQNLRVDYSQITATSIFQLMDLQVAIASGASADSLSEFTHHPDPATTFTPQSTDVWINGLWFMSLTLSLATTLISVLARQWIQEFTTIPSGTPRLRSRIRQFRYSGVLKWHVPLIIGLLPVLMHMSLGLFFTGLVMYLYALNGAITAVLGATAGLTFLAYFASNILPLFFPECPYKTPVSHYSHFLLRYARRHLRFVRLIHQDVPVFTIPAESLKDIERRTVLEDSSIVDAESVTWLHNTSSNASVQSVALQALSAISLQSLDFIKGPNGITWAVTDGKTLPVLEAIKSHHRYKQPVDRLERFQRASWRFGGFRDTSDTTNRYDLIHFPDRGPEQAMQMVRDNLLGVSKATFDVVVWGKIFERALRTGLDFLEINTAGGAPSPLWEELLKAAVPDLHDCKVMCGKRAPDLFIFSLGSEKKKETRRLAISRYSLENIKDGTSSTLSRALSRNMYPSFVQWVLDVGFPGVDPSSLDHPEERMPKDIFLLFTMLQTHSVQLTSSRHKDDPNYCLFGRVLSSVDYLAHNAIRFQTPSEHTVLRIHRAAIQALKSVVSSPSFGTGTVLTPHHEARLLETLLTALNRRLEFSEPGDHDGSWLTPVLFQRLWAFASKLIRVVDVPYGCRVAAHFFAYVSRFATHDYATEEIYTHLVETDWLNDIGQQFDRLVLSPDQSVPPENGLAAWWCPGYTFIGRVYLDGISSRSGGPNSVVQRARAYISRQKNLSTMAKILLFSDFDHQNALWQLAVQVRGKEWAQCLQELAVLASCSGACEAYAFVRLRFISKINTKDATHYRPFEMLPSLVSILATDVARGKFTPPTIGAPAPKNNVEVTTTPVPVNSGRLSKIVEYWRSIFRWPTRGNASGSIPLNVHTRA